MIIVRTPPKTVMALTKTFCLNPSAVEDLILSPGQATTESPLAIRDLQTAAALSRHVLHKFDGEGVAALACQWRRALPVSDLAPASHYVGAAAYPVEEEKDKILFMQNWVAVQALGDSGQRRLGIATTDIDLIRSYGPFSTLKELTARVFTGMFGVFPNAFSTRYTAHPLFPNDPAQRMRTISAFYRPQQPAPGTTPLPAAVEVTPLPLFLGVNLLFMASHVARPFPDRRPGLPSVRLMRNIQAAFLRGQMHNSGVIEDIESLDPGSRPGEVYFQRILLPALAVFAGEPEEPSTRTLE